MIHSSFPPFFLPAIALFVLLLLCISPVCANNTTRAYRDQFHAAKPMPVPAISNKNVATPVLAATASAPVLSALAAAETLRLVSHDLLTGTTTTESVADAEVRLSADAEVRLSADAEVRLSADAEVRLSAVKAVPPLHATTHQFTTKAASDLTQVTDATVHPYSRFVSIVFDLNGASYRCSGSIVGSSRSVLTAGHCLYDPATQVWASNIRVYPGQGDAFYPTYSDLAANDNAQADYIDLPLGQAIGVRSHAYTAWISSGDQNHNWGFITLDRAVPGGHLGAITSTPSIWSVSAYPGTDVSATKPYVHSFKRTGSLISNSTTLASVDMKVYAGDSGGGVYDGANNVFGVVIGPSTSGPSPSYSMLLTSEKIQSMITWMATDNNEVPIVPKPYVIQGMFPSSLRSISRTSMATTESLSVTFTLFNAGPVDSGIVTITFRASSNAWISTNDLAIHSGTTSILANTMKDFSVTIPTMPSSLAGTTVWIGATWSAATPEYDTNWHKMTLGKVAFTTCGVGLHPAEECLSGACCSSLCKFESISTICSPASGPCQHDALCTGSSSACPSNTFKSATTVCAAPTGDCENAAVCTGNNATCPAKTLKASEIICATSTGPCELDAKCNGTSTACPAKTFKTTATVCSAASGPCENAAQCDGTNAACPTKTFKTTTTVCSVAFGPCENDAHCSGSGATCPSKLPKPDTVVCDTASGPCEDDSKCLGWAAWCPSKKLKAAGTVCDAASGVCENAGICSGSSTSCSAKSLKPSTSACVTPPVGGVCQDRVNCTGASPTCPSTGFKSTNFTCRPAVDSCDVAETCSGTSFSCPPDVGICTYAWSVGAFETCAATYSQSCGSPGLRTRAVICRRGDGLAVSDSLCAGTAKPSSSEGCIYEGSCTYTWTLGTFGPCQKTCMQSRINTCLRSDGVRRPASSCSSSPTPPNYQACSGDACVVGGEAWFMGPFSMCSATCQRTRTVSCMKNGAPTAYILYCGHATTRPVASVPCSGDLCTFSWKFSSFSECQHDCQRYRSVTCQHTNGTTVSDSDCSAEKPISSRACGGESCASSEVSFKKKYVSLTFGILYPTTKTARKLLQDQFMDALATALAIPASRLSFGTMGDDDFEWGTDISFYIWPSTTATEPSTDEVFQRFKEFLKDPYSPIHTSDFFTKVPPLETDPYSLDDEIEQCPDGSWPNVTCRHSWSITSILGIFTWPAIALVVVSLLSYQGYRFWKKFKNNTSAGGAKGQTNMGTNDQMDDGMNGENDTLSGIELHPVQMPTSSSSVV